MKVYLVTGNDYDGSELIGIFSSRKEAKKCQEAYRNYRGYSIAIKEESVQDYYGHEDFYYSYYFRKGINGASLEFVHKEKEGWDINTLWVSEYTDELGSYVLNIPEKSKTKAYKIIKKYLNGEELEDIEIYGLEED